MNVNKALEEYFFWRNIYLRDKYFICNEVKSEDQVLAHITLIAEFQKILFNFNTIKFGGVNSLIGKDLDKIKTAYIVLKNLEDDKTYNVMRNTIENLLINLDEINLKSLVKRSVDRKEISIGRLDEKNLRILDEIEVGKIKKINYNLIEEDAIKYIVRARKNVVNLNLDKIINEYILKANLGQESEKYIKNMVLVPWDSIKYIYKFKSKIDKKMFKELMIIDKVI